MFGSSAALNVLARRHRRSSSLELLRTKRSIIFLVSSPNYSTMPIRLRERALQSSPSAIGLLVFILGLVGPIGVEAEIISIPSEAVSSSPVAALPLRGSPPSTAKLVPGCPPGYTVGPDYSCLAPSVGDYSSGWPGYDYWPDWGWGWGWGYGRFPSSRGSHGFARFHGFRHFGHFAGVHRFAGFHGFGDISVASAGDRPLLGSGSL